MLPYLQVLGKQWPDCLSLFVCFSVVRFIASSCSVTRPVCVCTRMCTARGSLFFLPFQEAGCFSYACVVLLVVNSGTEKLPKSDPYGYSVSFHSSVETLDPESNFPAACWVRASVMPLYILFLPGAALFPLLKSLAGLGFRRCARDCFPHR